MEINNNSPLIGNIISQNCFEAATPEERFNTIQLVYKRTLEALEAITNLDLGKFDALVGDQACQIRTLKILLLSKEDFSLEINLLKNQIDKLVCLKLNIQNDVLNDTKDLKEKRLLLYKESIDDQLKNQKNKAIIIETYKNNAKAIEENIIQVKQQVFESYLNDIIATDISVSKDVLFVTEAYFLALTKITLKDTENPFSDYKNATNQNLIQIKDLNCGKKSLGENSFNDMKQSLSVKSVEFVKELAREINFPDDLLKVQVNKRNELPFLYMTEVIFIKAMDAKIPILLKIKKIKEKVFDCKIFYNNGNENSTGIVIEAFSQNSRKKLQSEEFRNSLTGPDIKITDIIKYNAAQHSQFVKISKKDPDIDFDKNQRDLKEKAKLIGFSEINSTLCCIDHIFCDRFSNQL